MFLLYWWIFVYLAGVKCWLSIGVRLCLAQDEEQRQRPWKLWLWCSINWSLMGRVKEKYHKFLIWWFDCVCIGFIEMQPLLRMQGVPKLWHLISLWKLVHYPWFYNFTLWLIWTKSSAPSTDSIFWGAPAEFCWPVGVPPYIGCFLEYSPKKNWVSQISWQPRGRSTSTPPAPTRPPPAAPIIRVHPAALIVWVHPAAPIVRVHPTALIAGVHEVSQPVRVCMAGGLG